MERRLSSVPEDLSEKMKRKLETLSEVEPNIGEKSSSSLHSLKATFEEKQKLEIKTEIVRKEDKMNKNDGDKSSRSISFIVDINLQSCGEFEIEKTARRQP